MRIYLLIEITKDVIYQVNFGKDKENVIFTTYFSLQ